MSQIGFPAVDVEVALIPELERSPLVPGFFVPSAWFRNRNASTGEVAGSEPIAVGEDTVEKSVLSSACVRSWSACSEGWRRSVLLYGQHVHSPQRVVQVLSCVANIRSFVADAFLQDRRYIWNRIR
jgi:hypothetical protein